MNTYSIHYFGMLAERRGLADESLTCKATNVRELYELLAAEHGFNIPHENLRAAVNEEMVSWDHPLKNGDPIAFLPPMSGG